MLDSHWNMSPNKAKALMLAKRQLAELVHDAVALEGIHFTLPEVQTLLDGVTVGGHKLSDQQIAINQANAWRALFKDIETGSFELTAKYAQYLHNIAGKEEALEWGCFRTGGVLIAGTEYMPPKASELDELYADMIASLQGVEDIYDKAITAFLTMARTQFFYDVNKRMGRFIMNGILLDAGFPAINLPAKRQQEFNTLMLAFYESGDLQPMNAFMRRCLDVRVIDIMSE